MATPTIIVPLTLSWRRQRFDHLAPIGLCLTQAALQARRQDKRFRNIMATAEGAEGAETEKTPAERLFESARDGDVAALDALLPDATAEQLHEDHQYEHEQGLEHKGDALIRSSMRGT